MSVQKSKQIALQEPTVKRDANQVHAGKLMNSSKDKTTKEQLKQDLIQSIRQNTKKTVPVGPPKTTLNRPIGDKIDKINLPPKETMTDEARFKKMQSEPVSKFKATNEDIKRPSSL